MIQSALVLTFLLAGAAAPASSTDDIVNKIISSPVITEYRVDGTEAHEIRKDPAVQGAKALRIHVPGKAAHEWDISLAVPITKPVKAGDELVLAMWIRLAAGENGATTVQLPFAGVQLNKEPYTPVISGPVTAVSDWKMQAVKGRADKDYKVGDIGVTVHLATAKQVIDFGPVFVLDMGQQP